MVKRKVPPVKRLVWRISEAAPLGEFVDPSATPPAPADATRKDLPEASSSGGWVVSSFELLHGTDVSDAAETIPDDLFDELFPDVPTDPSDGPRKDK